MKKVGRMRKGSIILLTGGLLCFLVVGSTSSRGDDPGGAVTGRFAPGEVYEAATGALTEGQASLTAESTAEGTMGATVGAIQTLGEVNLSYHTGQSDVVGFEADLSGEANLGAEAGYDAFLGAGEGGKYGAFAEGEAWAGLGAALTADAQVTVGELGLDANVSAEATIDASGEGQIGAYVSTDGAYVGGKAEGVLGAEASVEGSVTAQAYGHDIVTATAEVTAYAGLAFHGELGLGMDSGGFTVEAALGAALGLGVGVEVNITIPPFLPVADAAFIATMGGPTTLEMPAPESDFGLDGFVASSAGSAGYGGAAGDGYYGDGGNTSVSGGGAPSGGGYYGVGGNTSVSGGGAPSGGGGGCGGVPSGCG